MVGSADISWEHRQNKNYYQLHWHIAMWTKDPEKLQKRLLRVFPQEKVRPARGGHKSFSLEFLPYMNKGIKLPDLLRRNRQHLPQLLLALHRTAPLELMVIKGLRLSAQSGCGVGGRGVLGRTCFSVSTPGWHGGGFVLPGKFFCSDVTAVPVIIDPNSVEHVGAFLRGEGDLSDWQRTGGRLARKSSPLRVAISAALAAPLLRKLNMDSFKIIRWPNIGRQVLPT